MKVTLQGKNIDTSADLSTASSTLKYGDMIVYSGNYNGLVFGWFIGLSLTGKTTYVLSANGSVIQDLQMMFWGAYYGCCKDKFGVQWMFNCTI